jgi:hypothetical protein
VTYYGLYHLTCGGSTVELIHGDDDLSQWEIDRWDRWVADQRYFAMLDEMDTPKPDVLHRTHGKNGQPELEAVP